MRVLALLALLAGGAAFAGPASSAVLRAGEGQAYPTLAAAARAAGNGDTIHLVAGTYYECAVLGQARLVVEGEGAGTVLTDRTCEDKALLVLRGAEATVRDLVLARARVADRNGAGIRLEAQGLRVERVRFENDEVGVLAGEAGPGAVVVQDCVFDGGGVAGERPSAALLVGAVGTLRVERSRFAGFRGAQVASAAGRTELVGNDLASGSEAGGGAVVSASGSLLMEDNAIALGPFAPPRGAAVLANGADATLLRNVLRNGTGAPAVLLLDWTAGTPRLDGNTVAAGDTLVSSAGSMRHRAGLAARDLVGGLRHAAGGLKRAVLGP